MGDRVTATLEDLHQDVIDSIRDEQGLASDAAAVRRALAMVAKMQEHGVDSDPGAVAAELETVQDLREELDAAEGDVERLQARLEDRDREFRMMSVLVPVALGIEQSQMAEMMPGIEEDELPELPATVQREREQRGAIQRFGDWLLGPRSED